MIPRFESFQTVLLVTLLMVPNLGLGFHRAEDSEVPSGPEFRLNVSASPTPGFARQTKLACSTSHCSFPQLNAFGRNWRPAALALLA